MFRETTYKKIDDFGDIPRFAQDIANIFIIYFPSALYHELLCH